MSEEDKSRTAHMEIDVSEEGLITVEIDNFGIFSPRMMQRVNRQISRQRNILRKQELRKTRGATNA